MDENEDHDRLSTSIDPLDSLPPPITSGHHDDTSYAFAPNENASKDDFEAMQKSSALFMRGLKEQHKIPQAVLQQILDGVTILTQTRLSVLQSEV